MYVIKHTFQLSHHNAKAMYPIMCLHREEHLAGAIDKDTLSFKDVDYGHSGAWAWSVTLW